MTDIYLLKYNNYYNRIVKKESSLSAYLSGRESLKVSDVNFVWNDGVNTTQVVNVPKGMTSETFEGNYLIVTDPGSSTIRARWFIIEAHWERKRQVTLILRRDLLVDYYDDYKNSPFFCEKGLVPASDPFIFNAEGMTFNQRKTHQTALTNPTGVPWVVVYFAKGLTGSGATRAWKNETFSYIYPGGDGYPETQDVVINARSAAITNGSYAAMCFPYGDCVIGYKVDGTNYTRYYTEEIANAVIEGISTSFKGGGIVYDIQILPFCPLEDFRWNKSYQQVVMKEQLSSIDSLYKLVIGPPIELAGASGWDRGIALIPLNNLRVTETYSYTYPYDLSNTENVKIDNECRFLRVVSPNGAAQFEFNAAKNGGVTSFKLDATLKPFSPVMRVMPDFGWLYTIAFDFEKRGAIARGDFSAVQTTSAWETYEIQNKSYQASFNRQIENMETTNAIQNERAIVSGVLGAGSASVSAGTAGAAVGGPVGAAVGAVAGGLTSGIGAAIDINYQKKLQNEALDYTRDMYSYSLENIKALPNTIANLGAQNVLVGPTFYVEVYSATGEEIEALKKKIEFNGMTIMRIGTVAEFKNNADVVYTSFDTKYIKGKLIRCEALEGDYHLLNELGAELNKGGFFY